MSQKPTLLVVGNGMVGQRLLESLTESGATEAWDVVAFCEERRPAYDRVNLSAYFDGLSAEDLSLTSEVVDAHPAITTRVGERVTAIDRDDKTATTSSGDVVRYDHLVLATGSYPFVPPIPGGDGPGCFVYRTLDDLDAIRDHAADCATGVVIGGGLLGLEAANALRSLGLRTHVVEFAPRLMPVQIDDAGSAVLADKITALGIGVHTSKATTAICRAQDGGRIERLTFADDTELATDLVVFSAGIRPRDELAREAGLEIGPRGGVLVDEAMTSSDPSISAIGEVAAFAGGMIYGLVAPGYDMARALADRLAGGDATFGGADMSTKLKLLGVDVASFGDAHAATEGARTIAWSDAVAGVYKKVVVDRRARKLLGGVLVGDASDYGALHQMMLNGLRLPDDPASLIAPASEGGGVALTPDQLPAEATICSCNNVSKGAICAAVADGAHAVSAVKSATRAGTSCGSCVPLCKSIIDAELEAAGIEVDHSICEHFAFTRQELFDVVRVNLVRTFDELVDGWGSGRGCEICRPAVASMLASLWNEYVLEDPHAGLQDTNDRALANLQKDGTYSVVPRVPGGEITPDKLIVLGEVAKEFDLYTKITGGQRVDLFGARLEQLPEIWGRLVGAGFESGHAYGKAMRTVKSCVGDTWCRYGVQDSVQLAIDLELRYRGLRSPHKLKLAVSGCARECAEAQSKDIGVIATEKGWNLYVCGNGGMRPQHATLLAEDLDRETLIRYIDRFTMYYVRTADRLERTAPWFNRLEGGIDYLRHVVVEDALGICDELEAAMAHHVETYRCEWKVTIADPEKVARFNPFVNAPGQGDPSLAYVRERDQRRPARPDELERAERPVPVTIGRKP